MFATRMPFARRSLSSVTAHFNRAITELENLQGQHGQDHEKLTARIAELSTKRDNIAAEVQQAETIAANLRSLLGNV